MGDSVRLGLYIDMRNAPAWRRPWAAHYARWLERIEEAERLGCPAVWLTEHHFFDDGYLPQCWTMAAAIAARTRTMRIGTAVALLPLHSALETAEQIAMVDLISGGRVEPGFGVGYRKPEYRAFGGDFKHRYGDYRAKIGAMRALWGESPGADRLVTPPPIQRPMPMWGGFGGPQGARMAGELGLGLQSIDPNLLAPYREGLTAGGHDPAGARMCGVIELFVTDDPERAWAQIAPHVAYRWQSYNRYMFEGTSREKEAPQYFDLDAVRRMFLIGTPAAIAEGLRQQISGLPVTDLYFWGDYPGLPDEAIDRHIRLAFTELAPLLAGSAAPGQPKGSPGQAAALSLADRLEIHELAARYGTVIDDRDWDGLASVFTEDALFVTSGFGDGDGRLEGVAAIRAMMDGAPHPVAHHVTNVMVGVDDLGVTMRSKIVGTLAKGRAGSADYRDRLRLTPQGWRIAERRVTLRRAQPIEAAAPT